MPSITAVGVGAAKQMMFTAKSIDAQKALHLGLVQDVVAEGELALHVHTGKQSPVTRRHNRCHYEVYLNTSDES